MNAAHLHLVLNHLPIFGFLFATLFLLYAHLNKDHSITTFSLIALFFFGVSAVVVYFTGEGAEEIVEHLPGRSEALIERHEEHGLIAVVACMLAGLMSLAASLMFNIMERRRSLLVGFTLATACVAIFILGMTGSSGGAISHPEVRTEFAAQSKNDERSSSTSRREQKHEDDHDDDDDHDN